MNDAPAVTVPSPCNQVCWLDAGGICIGCGRSGGEIAEWTRADSARRLQIRAAARARLASKTAQAGELLDRGPL
jgi:predicted Fe-S protein YdhL (DUF1289 family)